VLFEPLRSTMVEISSWALVAAIAGLGITTSLKDLATVGPKALVLIVAETVWIAAIGLTILLLVS
jgi:uncharacterized membrane protein YadS